MSEGPNSTAALTEVQKPSEQNVQLIHEIVLRAQNNPLENDRNSLITAYEAILREHQLDSSQDEVCLRLIEELLRPDIPGDHLYAKLEHIMRNRGIELVFADETTTSDGDSAPISDGSKSQHHQPSEQLNGHNASPQPLLRGAINEAINDDLSSAMLQDLNDHTPPEIRLLMQQAIMLDRRTLMRQTLGEIRDAIRNTRLRALELKADQMYQYRLKYKVLTHWQNMQRQAMTNFAKADEWHETHQNSRILSHMFDSARVNRLQAMDQERLRGMGLYKMTLAARESTFRRWLDFKSKKRCLRTLADSLRAVSMNHSNLEGILRRFQSKSNSRLAQTAFTAVTNTCQLIISQDQSAVRHHETRLKRTAFGNLSRNRNQIVEMAVKADNARDFVLERQLFMKMWEAFQAKVSRRTVLVRWSLKQWRKHVKAKKDEKYETRYKEIRRNYKMKIARRCLRLLHEKSQNLTQLQQQVQEHRDTKLRTFSHRIVVTWYNRSQEIRTINDTAEKHADDLAMNHALTALSEKQQQLLVSDQRAEQYRQVHIQDISTQCLRALARKAFDVHRRQQDADAFRARRDRQLNRNTFDQFRRKLADLRGEGPLVLPPATPAQRRADQMNRLASTTPLIPPNLSFNARLRGEGGTFGFIEDEDAGQG